MAARAPPGADTSQLALQSAEKPRCRAVLMDQQLSRPASCAQQTDPSATDTAERRESATPATTHAVLPDATAAVAGAAEAIKPDSPSVRLASSAPAADCVLNCERRAHAASAAGAAAGVALNIAMAPLPQPRSHKTSAEHRKAGAAAVTRPSSNVPQIVVTERVRIALADVTGRAKHNGRAAERGVLSNTASVHSQVHLQSAQADLPPRAGVGTAKAHKQQQPTPQRTVPAEEQRTPCDPVHAPSGCNRKRQRQTPSGKPSHPCQSISSVCSLPTRSRGLQCQHPCARGKLQHTL